MGNSLPSRILTVVVFAAVLLTAKTIAAHPMGNFSISRYAAIRFEKDAVEIRYIVDMAEIPAFQEIQENGIFPDSGGPTLTSYLAEKIEVLKEGLVLMIDGRRLVLRAESQEAIFPPGAGGLPTMKIGALYKASVEKIAPDGRRTLYYRDDNFAGRAGWKEVIASGGDEVKLFSSSVPEKDRSHRLSDYPTDLLNSPPQVAEARIVFGAPAAVASAKSVPPAKPARIKQSLENITPPSGAVSNSPVAKAPIETPNSIRLEANRQSTPRNSFTELMTNSQSGVGILLLALALSAGLGAFHALEPGHGKTLVAAYLVGSRGTARHALWLGLIVTAAHTAGVYLLGGLTLYASRYVVPERLYPWLGLASGVLITAMGLFLFLRRYSSDGSFPVGVHSHHGPAGGHHHSHGHTHHHHHEHKSEAGVSLRQLVALGIGGGIVPCPAALVVLLSAVALQRVGFGLILIVAFSAGLAAVLISVGLLVVYAQRLIGALPTGRWTARWLPLASSAFIMLFGMALAFQGLGAAGLIGL